MRNPAGPSESQNKSRTTAAPTTSRGLCPPSPGGPDDTGIYVFDNDDDTGIYVFDSDDEKVNQPFRCFPLVPMARPNIFRVLQLNIHLNLHQPKTIQ
jgi:hypothetical protein